MNSLRAVKCFVCAGAVVLWSADSFATTAPHSWGGRAADEGGELVEAIVRPDGGLVIERSLCEGSRLHLPDVAKWQAEEPRPAAGSRVVGIYRSGSGQLDVVDLAWTRWALDLSSIYSRSVCLAGRRPDRASRYLREGWRDLLAIPDQRARDEASRLAVDFPQWASDLKDRELTLLIGALVRFSVDGDEALRWIRFVSLVPPGEQMLALLRVAEASRRPFFRTMRHTVAQLWRDDPSFRSFCAGLSQDARPQVCMAVSSLP